MKIALIAPPWFAVPPVGYGGIEYVVSQLADGLVASGHDVTLFAAGGSVTDARLHTIFKEPQTAQIGNVGIEAAHVVDAYSHWREFDLIHDHTFTGLVAAPTVPVPVVHTVHGPITSEMSGLYGAIGRAVHLVAISAHQRSMLPPGCESTLVHNALPVEQFPSSEEPGDYLLFVGRVNAEKGILEAIEIARRAGLPLKMIVKANEQPERKYLRERVLPALSGVDAEILEQPPQAVKLEAYRGALATLFPIMWPEPFGLVMIESMATGTPVIAFPRGSVPEVVVDGETGFICDTIQDAAGAVSRVRKLDRARVRAHVAANFNVEANLEKHKRLYQRLVSRWRHENGAAMPGSPKLPTTKLLAAPLGQSSEVA